MYLAAPGFNLSSAHLCTDLCARLLHGKDGDGSSLCQTNSEPMGTLLLTYPGALMSQGTSGKICLCQLKNRDVSCSRQTVIFGVKELAYESSSAIHSFSSSFNECQPNSSFEKESTDPVPLRLHAVCVSEDIKEPCTAPDIGPPIIKSPV
jgi:hypothetical protein